MKKIKDDLASILKDFSALTRRLEKVLAAIESIESTRPDPMGAGEDAASVTKGKGPAAGKGTRKRTDSDKVVAMIRRHKNGIDVGRLKKKTGYNDKKISNIVHRASKKGLIKRIGRGLYAGA